MRVTPIHIDLLAEMESKRTGLHLSSIIKALCIGLDPKRFGGGPTSATYVRFEIGFAFEELLSRRSPPTRGLISQASVERDGVQGTIDVLDIRADPYVVHESKATWMSAKNTPDSTKMQHWIWQIKGYCHMVGTHRARLEVLFVNGDYKPMEPCFKAWDLEFSQRELKDNWTMLMNQRKAMEQKRRKRG